MSPYPAQVDRTRIVQAARELIEAEGIDALSLGQLAAALGIKAPSLYRHVSSKTELLQAVNTATIEDLIGAIRTATPDDSADPRERLRQMALTYRSFAHAHPVTYALAFANLAPELRIDERQAEALVIPIQEIVAVLVGPERSLPALRGFLALLHGFVILELSEQFRRGGDLTLAYTQSVEAYINGWSG